MTFIRLIVLLAVAALSACTNSIYGEDGQIILPAPPSARIMAQETALDRALANRMTAYDVETNLGYFGAAALTAVIVCRRADCPPSTTAQVAATSFEAITEIAGPLPQDPDTRLLRSEALDFAQKAKARADWSEMLLEISEAFVQMGERDLEVLSTQSGDPSAWAALYQMRADQVGQAAEFVAPVVANLTEAQKVEALFRVSPLFRQSATRATGAQRALLANQEKLGAIAEQMAAIKSE